MRSILVRLEHIAIYGIDLLVVTLPCAFDYIFGIVGSKQPETDLTRTLMRDWFHN
jgi:hypothetical protein